MPKLPRRIRFILMNESEAAAVCTRVDELLRAPDLFSIRELPTPDGYVLFLFSRVHSTFLAVSLLIDRRLVDEAMQLSRSLMTDALRLLEFDRVGAERHTYILGWVNASLTENESLITEATRLGLEHEPDAALEAIREQRRKLQRYQRRHEIGTLKRIASERQLAMRHGLEQEFWDFEYVSNVVHGTPFTGGHRMTRREDGTMLVATYQDDEGWRIRIRLLAAQWTLRALRSYRRMIVHDVPLPRDIDELLAMLNQVDVDA